MRWTFRSFSRPAHRPCPFPAPYSCPHDSIQQRPSKHKTHRPADHVPEPQLRHRRVKEPLLPPPRTRHGGEQRGNKQRAERVEEEAPVRFQAERAGCDAEEGRGERADVRYCLRMWRGRGSAVVGGTGGKSWWTAHPCVLLHALADDWPYGQFALFEHRCSGGDGWDGVGWGRGKRGYKNAETPIWCVSRCAVIPATALWTSLAYTQSSVPASLPSLPTRPPPARCQK